MWVNRFLQDINKKVNDIEDSMSEEDLKCSFCTTCNATMYAAHYSHTKCDSCDRTAGSCILCQNDADKSESEKLEVQFFFGCGIREGIEHQKTVIERVESKKNNDKNSEDVLLAKANLKRAMNLRMLHEDVMCDNSYLEKYYPKYL